MTAKITVSPLRGKAAKISNHKRSPGKRGQCSGWTMGAARRNADFLGSIDPELLTGYGVACSLTVRDAPPSPQVWAAMREALLKRLKRMGLIRFHWVTEWQMRSRHGGGPVPHMHGIFYFTEPPNVMAEWVKRHWLDISAEYGTEMWAQNAKGVPQLAGWLQYLTKHGSRSVGNVQRLRGCIPDAWETAGRLWGQGGDWPTRSTAFVTHDAVFYAYRRLLRNHARAEAAARLQRCRAWGGNKLKAAVKSVTHSRQILKYPRAPRAGLEAQTLPPSECADLSRVRGVAGFLREADVLRWLYAQPQVMWREVEDHREAPEGAAPPTRLASPRGRGSASDAVA